MKHRSFDQIYPICRTVEREIVGQMDDRVCDWWAAKNAFRHGLTLNFLDQLATEQRDTPLKIFNMSGLSCGHQDFSIAHYLRGHRVPFVYHALEHPATPYRKNPEFVKLVEEYGINIVWEPLGTLNIDQIRKSVGLPDVVLFTEIAEHLEYGDLLRSLALIHETIPDQGRLVLTTPNRDRFKFRLNTLRGQDIDHWGDGLLNQERQLFGHIVYYNIPRLRKLLGDAGLVMNQASTVDYPFHDPGLSGVGGWWQNQKTRMTRLLITTGEKAWRVPPVMNTLKTLGEQIFIVAHKGPRQEIPFAL